MACNPCGNSCTSCTNACGSGCGGCGGSCSGARCGAGCGDACSDGCGGGCGSQCSGQCSNACAQGCATGCTSGCTGGCHTACGKQCTGGAQAENFTNLKLEKKFVANNIQFISDFVNYEVSRRDETPETITFSQKERLDDTKINKIISNLKKVNSQLNLQASEKKRGLRSFAEDIIKEATTLYNTDYQSD